MTAAQKRILLVVGAIVALLAVFLVALLALGTNSSGKASVTIQTIVPTAATVTPAATPTATPTTPASPAPPSVTARTRAPVSIYTIPDQRGAIVARLQAGLVLSVAGRSDDDRWLLVDFTGQNGAPANGSGWVQIDAVDLAGDLLRVPVLATIPTPTPTSTPSPTPSPSPTPTRTPSPTASPTRVPTQPPAFRLVDLSLIDFNVPPGASGLVVVVVGNVGAADLVGQLIEIVGYDQTGAQVLTTTTGPVSIKAGGSLQITTNFRPTTRTMLTVVINPNHTIPEADAPPGFDDPNNSRTKTVFPASGG